MQHSTFEAARNWSLLSDAYRTEFDTLLRTLAEHDYHGSLTGFWPMIGAAFLGRRTLLVIGRAVNGWQKRGWAAGTLRSAVKRRGVVCDLTEHEKCPECPMSWLKKSLKNDRYNFHRSAFWRLVQDIALLLNCDKGEWSSQIAWSNLYKVAPFDSGNPDGILIRTQIRHCIKLLAMEISEINPKVVLCVAGADWFDPFAEGLGLEMRGPEHPMRFVQQISRSQGRTWIVGKHPQGKPAGAYIREIESILREECSG